MAKRVIAHFTDTHLGQKLVAGDGTMNNALRYDHSPGEHQEQLRVILDDIARRNISDVIFGGDIGSADSVQPFFEILGDYAFKATMVLGNHDNYDQIARYLRGEEHAVEGGMCSARGGPFLKEIVLDTSSNSVSEDQLAWLAREIRDVRKLMLFMHHPVLDIDTPVEQAGASLQNRQELKTLLRQAACDVLVFCGHYHMADERSEANIRQFVTPAASYQIIKHADRIRFDQDSFGYRILEIEGADVRTEVVLFGNSFSA